MKVKVSKITEYGVEVDRTIEVQFSDIREPDELFELEYSKGELTMWTPTGACVGGLDIEALKHAISCIEKARSE